MPRIQRVDVSGEVYHVLNRANARVEFFGRVVRESGIEHVLKKGLASLLDAVSLKYGKISVYE